MLDPCGPKRMGRECTRQSGVFEPAFEHYASAIELFRYNLTTPDDRKFQYIFDVSDPASQSAGDALSREEIVNRATLTWKPATLFFRICRAIQRKLLWSACLGLSGSALTDRAPSRCSVSAPTPRCRVGSRNWPTNAPKGVPVLYIYDTRKERISNPDSLRLEIQALTDFLCSNKIEILNVAGPRESKEHGVYDWTLTMLRAIRAKAR
jgi:hypothetical protein